MSAPGRMTQRERDDLARLARKRAQLAKARVAERQRVLLAEAEDLLAARYDPDEDAWAEAHRAAEAAMVGLNDRIRQVVAALGIPAEFAPTACLVWYGRGENAAAERRAELRRVAQTRLEALAASAKGAIEERLLEVETELVREGLTSAGALAFLDRMPAAEELMPPLTLGDLGVPEAAALLKPSTAADRKRAAIRRAIAQNPDASNRQVAAIVGCDHKTVAAYRNGESAGEVAGDSPPEVTS
jgi:hypothetical protein